MIKKYIDAEALINNINLLTYKMSDEVLVIADKIIALIDDMPAENVCKPEYPKHATWIQLKDDLYYCTNCGYEKHSGTVGQRPEDNFCANCGAKMSKFKPENLSKEELKQLTEAVIKNATEQIEKYYYLYPGLGDNK